MSFQFCFTYCFKHHVSCIAYHVKVRHSAIHDIHVFISSIVYVTYKELRFACQPRNTFPLVVFMDGCVMCKPFRQDVQWRREDDLIWARTQVFRTSLFVADVEKTLHRRRVWIGRTNDVLRTSGGKRTSGKLTFGPKLGRPLDVMSEKDVLWTTLAEWEVSVSTLWRR